MRFVLPAHQQLQTQPLLHEFIRVAAGDFTAQEFEGIDGCLFLGHFDLPFRPQLASVNDIPNGRVLQPEFVVQSPICEPPVIR